ncbi:DUF2459 domain-containing protein [bacterium]|nr:DUF2459 domain-containing protein [bacterium]
MSHRPPSIAEVTDSQTGRSRCIDVVAIPSAVEVASLLVEHRSGQTSCECRPASPWRAARLLSSLVAVTFSLGACTSTVVPPVDVVDPVEIFVLSEAIHTGIVLPPDPGASGNPGQYVEFGFGDWSYYALENVYWFQAIDTVLWPTQGTLCRRAFGARAAEELSDLADEISLQSMIVSRKDASKLRRRLQAEFDEARKFVIVNRDSNLKFVPTDYSYWLPYNCVDVAVDWLVELGCEVSWRPIRDSLLVADQGK